jgi:hypothetical protein
MGVFRFVQETRNIKNVDYLLEGNPMALISVWRCTCHRTRSGTHFKTQNQIEEGLQMI